MSSSGISRSVLLTWFDFIPSIDKYLQPLYRMWAEITHPFPNFTGATVEGNLIPYLSGHVITYPYWDQSYTMLVKGAPDELIIHTITIAIHQPHFWHITLAWARSQIRKMEIYSWRYSQLYFVNIYTCLNTIHNSLKLLIVYGAECSSPTGEWGTGYATNNC